MKSRVNKEMPINTPPGIKMVAPGILVFVDDVPVIISTTDQQSDLVKDDQILFNSRQGYREVYTYVECDGYGMGVLSDTNQRCTLAYSSCSRILLMDPELLDDDFTAGEIEQYKRLPDGIDVFVELSADENGKAYVDCDSNIIIGSKSIYSQKQVEDMIRRSLESANSGR